jgi:hypothetical protein
MFKNASKFAPLLFLLPLRVFASACCGGAFALPAIITGDDAAQLSTSFAQSRIDADVGTDGIWSKRTDNDITKILKIDGARIFADRWQLGFSIPVQSRTKDGAGDSSGIGDVGLQAGYEYLPEWDYSPWKPRGVGFLNLTLPTGKAFEEATLDDGGLSSRGRGFWSVGAGTIFTKIIRTWDANAVIEGHRSFERSSRGNTYVPGYGGSLTLGAGWNHEDLRLGGGIGWNQEDAVDVRGQTSSSGHRQNYATGTLSASYMLAQNWAATISYSDQTWFGDPASVSLARSVALVLQKRWTR